MFCVHCGTKLQDDARFCSNCGKKTVLNCEENPPIQEQEPPREYTPVQKKEPIHKAPPVLENDTLQQSFVPPMRQNWSPPVSDKTASVGTPGSIKLLIPIAAAVIMVLLLLTAVIAYSLGSSDKPAEEKETSSPNSSSQSDDSAFSGTTSDAMEERYNEEGFFFTHEEFRDLYGAVLAEKDSPFTVGKSQYTLETGLQWDLLYKNKPAIYFNTTEDPSTGLITTVKAGHNGLTAGYEEVTDEEIDAILYIIEACHGPLTEKQWDSVYNAKPTLDTDTIKIYDLEIDGLIIKITTTETTYSIDIYAGEPQTSSAAKETSKEVDDDTPDVDPNVIAKFPYGKNRFDSKTFLYTHKEFADLYNLVLMANKPDYSLGNPSDVGDGKYNYPFRYQGDKVGFVIVQVNSSGKVTNISINYDFDPDKDVAQEGISAALFILKAAHGDMSDGDWTSIFEEKPTAVRDNYSMFSYDLSGMSANMLLYSDRLHLNMEVE